MNPGISCPRCARLNPSRARFCANCGLSFLSAGVLPGLDRAGKSGGSGLLGVMAGFLLVFALVALLSLARAALPRHGEFGSRCVFPIEQRQSRLAPAESEQIIRREARWVFELPSRPAIHIQRHQCQ